MSPSGDKEERKTHETLKHFFGEEWIENEMGKLKLDGYKNLNPMNLARMQWHPLIKAIVGTQIKLTRADKTKGVALGGDELFQELLHKNLTILEPFLDIENVRRRLRDTDEFPKIQYELAIAAGYARMDYKVEFIPRSATARTGEFYIFNDAGKSLLIECKKKDFTSAKAQKLSAWWDEFQHLLTQRIIESKKSYGVIVHIPDTAVRTDIPALISESMTLITADFEGEKNLCSDKYRTSFKHISGNEEEETPTDIGVSRALINIKTGERTGQLRINGTFPHDYIEEKIASAMSSIKQAYGQLDGDKPNVVYVDIGVASLMPDEAREIMVRLPVEIEKKLQKDYSKISALVLTDIALLRHTEIMGMRADEAVIYNPNAKHPIGSDFRLYGDMKNGQSIRDDLDVMFG